MVLNLFSLLTPELTKVLLGDMIFIHISDRLTTFPLLLQNISMYSLPGLLQIKTDSHQLYLMDELWFPSMQLSKAQTGGRSPHTSSAFSGSFKSHFSNEVLWLTQMQHIHFNQPGGGRYCVRRGLNLKVDGASVEGCQLCGTAWEKTKHRRYDMVVFIKCGHS